MKVQRARFMSFNITFLKIKSSILKIVIQSVMIKKNNKIK